MNPNHHTLLCVASHLAVANIAYAHLTRFWFLSKCKIRVTDSDGSGPGPAGHNGPLAIRRMKNIFTQGLFEAERIDVKFVIFTEYDGITLARIPEHPQDGTIHTVLHPNGDPQFTAKEYPHGFLWMELATLRTLVKHLEDLPDDAEMGMGDRWLARLALTVEDVKFTNSKLMFSRNSIDRPEYVADACDAIRKGAIMIHGIKSAEMFENICLHFINTPRHHNHTMKDLPRRSLSA